MAKKLMTKREIKNFIKESMKRKAMSWSAGVVIVKRDILGEWKFLALKKFNGQYDIAKGIVEPGEKNLECAIREAEEEASITLSDDNFIWGEKSISYGRGIAYLAISEDTPKVKPNPETDELEHKSASWVSFDEMIVNVSDFLRPAILWAYRVITGG